ncbi:hypothetical protein Francci3_2639 [Frankia casuarinae]|uniref:Uncharacterized protein n=1 Tax=Frankia casuarinae (strain DSM 45818 / CECT 9043 / HFP020203 / CcI3) TaxID=106370 RepID=Q2J9P1_FRACC|nr:hypothetical protein Francci3_2639 [Frankia casuarinae]
MGMPDASRRVAHGTVAGGTVAGGTVADGTVGVAQLRERRRDVGPRGCARRGGPHKHGLGHAGPAAALGRAVRIPATAGIRSEPIRCSHRIDPEWMSDPPGSSAIERPRKGVPTRTSADWTSVGSPWTTSGRPRVTGSRAIREADVTHVGSGQESSP